MSKTYSCDLCKKDFSQKIDFTRHKNKKTPCISLSEIQEMIQAKEVKQDNKTELINVFKACLNIMRDNEGLTGEKALRNMSYLLILKLIEPHFGNEIDIDNYDYPFVDYFGDDVIEANKKRLLHIIRFSNLSAEKEDDLPNLIDYAWNIILSQHPTTKNIFLKGKGFDIQHKSTYKKLIDKFNSIDISNTEYDILGNAYEEVIQHIMTGKVFGQFFTMPNLKELMVNLIDPQIHADGTIETCGDPTMGTGGFLITYLKHILKQAEIKNIKPDWNFIKTEGLYGKELEPDTYQLAVSNMLISSGHMFEQLERGDSIRDPITRKFDNILANPPFGIKGLKYDEFKSSLKNEYLPIRSDNAVSLFIQVIIYMLKINGKCAVVLPDGQDLFSKTNKTLVAVREFLMKTCDLKEIIYLPAGMFEYTSIKTCIFYFIKKQDGGDVLEFKDKVTRTQKVTGREYKFSKTHQTTVVNFYEYNQNKDEKFLLVEVPIEKIANNSYSLNYAEYTKEEKQEEEECDNEVVMKKIHELFNFNTGPLQAMKCDESNIYPVISSSDIHSHSSFELDEENLFILKIFDGSAGKTYTTKIKYFNGKCNFTSLLYHMSPINKDILNIKYIYYYLTNNVDYISKKYQKGSCNKSLDLDSFLNFKIPIPSLERQESIVKYLDFIYEKSIKTSQEKIKDLKMANEYCLNNQINCGRNVVKTLGEVCNFDIGGTPLRSKNEYYENGNNLWVSVRELNGGYIYDTKEKLTELGVQNSSVKLFEKDTILFSFKLSIGKTAIVGNPLYTNEAIAGILSKNNDLLSNKYLYYYLTINDFSKLGSGVLGNGSLNKKSLEQIEIPIPSLKRQREIVAYCEANHALIKQLEEEIKRNKKQAQEFMDSVASLSTEDEEQEKENITTVVDTNTTDVIIQYEEDKQDETKSDCEITDAELSEENESDKNDDTTSIISNPKPKKTKKVKNIKKKLIIVEE